MKSNTIKTTALLAFVGLGLLSGSAKALSYSNGDLMLGFYSPTAANDVLIDLGSAASFDNVTINTTLSLGNLNAELKAQFGDNWASRTDLYWGVFGATNNAATANDPKNTLYAGREETTLGSIVGGYLEESNSTQAPIASAINTLGANYGTPNFGTDSTNSPTASIQSKTLAGSFATYQANLANSFGYFNGALGNFANGASGTELDLFRILNSSTGGGTADAPGTYEGTFTITNSGTVTFSTAPTAVPEPATVYVSALLVGLVAWRQRRSLTALFSAKLG